MAPIPPPTDQPCNDCPWRRVALAGWLGPYDAAKWLEIAHSDSAVACHKTIRTVNEQGVGDWNHPAMRQCRGLAMFRANMCKLPRFAAVPVGPVDHDRVFSNGPEFLAHHEGT